MFIFYLVSSRLVSSRLVLFRLVSSCFVLPCLVSQGSLNKVRSEVAGTFRADLNDTLNEQMAE